MKAKTTQGRRLIAALKRKAHTYLEMNLLCISISPHRRIAECLRDGQWGRRRPSTVPG